MIGTGENYELDKAIGNHMLSMRDAYFAFFEKMYAHLKTQKDKSAWYGDMDFIFRLVHDEQKGDKFTRAFEVRNTCTCADECMWLVVITGSSYKQELHVRVIWKTGDYPRAQFPKKLNLRFWRARNFVVDFVEKHHMTNLGGVYGDIRDTGYVISYEKHSIPDLDQFSARKDDRHLWHFYGPWKSFTGMLHSCECQMDGK